MWGTYDSQMSFFVRGFNWRRYEKFIISESPDGAKMPMLRPPMPLSMLLVYAAAGTINARPAGMQALRVGEYALMEQSRHWL